METLYIKGTQDTPEIRLDKEKNLLQIAGSSFTENPIDFYKPVISWFEKYAADPNDETLLELKIPYLNTASSKQISDILILLDQIKKPVKANWYYDKLDEDMEFEGETLRSLVEYKIELIPI